MNDSYCEEYKIEQDVWLV